MEMNNAPQPAQAGSMQQPPAMGKQIKIPSVSLPAGAKEGDVISLKVSSINEATGEAYLMADSQPEQKDEMPQDEEGETEEDGDEPKSELDTKTLLGPMDGLKSYLVQKSMDVPKNQGRS